MPGMTGMSLHWRDHLRMVPFFMAHRVSRIGKSFAATAASVHPTVIQEVEMPPRNRQTRVPDPGVQAALLVPGTH